MKATINGKRYDTAKCEELGSYDTYNNGNYSGTVTLLRASNGQLLVWADTNGQDCFRHDYLVAWDSSDIRIDSFDLTPEQTKRCAELGLIEVIS